MNPLTVFARRFIAGETIEDAIEAVSKLNRGRMTATLDILGENVKSERAARDAADSYIHLLGKISSSGISSNVSLKLTQMGLDIGEEFCCDNVKRVVDRAMTLGNFVRIDMEGSEYTQRTLDVFRKLRKDFENVGIVIQAYLFRSEKDINELLTDKTRIRLCKGAYKEPPSISFNRKEKTNENFIHLMEVLLEKGHYPAIATHDPAMIEATREFAKKNNIRKNRFEFQMLYGIGRKLQRELVQAGYNMRVYVPYGTHWLPYFVRRLRERKENIFFVLRHLFGD